MKTIYKYKLDVNDSQIVILPKGAIILSIQTQHNMPVLWAEVDPAASKEAVMIEMFGTGHPIPESEGRHYISTFQMNSGDLVFHAYEYTGEINDRNQV